MKLPVDLANEWRRFLDTKPTTAEQGDWLQLKAAEHGLDFYELSLALHVGVQRAELRHPEDEPPDVN